MAVLTHLYTEEGMLSKLEGTTARGMALESRVKQDLIFGTMLTKKNRGEGKQSSLMEHEINLKRLREISISSLKSIIVMFKGSK